MGIAPILLPGYALQRLPGGPDTVSAYRRTPAAQRIVGALPGALLWRSGGPRYPVTFCRATDVHRREWGRTLRYQAGDRDRRALVSGSVARRRAAAIRIGRAPGAACLVSIPYSSSPLNMSRCLRLPRMGSEFVIFVALPLSNPPTQSPLRQCDRPDGIEFEGGVRAQGQALPSKRRLQSPRDRGLLQYRASIPAPRGPFPLAGLASPPRDCAPLIS